MLKNIEQFILENTPDLEQVPENIRHSVAAKLDKFDYSYSTQGQNLIIQEENFLYLKKEQLAYSVKFNFNKELNPENYIEPLMGVWKIVTPNFQKKRFYTREDFNRLQELVEIICKDLKLESLEFVRNETLCACPLDLCEHYYLATSVLKKMSQDRVFVLALLKLTQVLEGYEVLLNSHKKKHLCEIQNRSSRNLSIPIKEKTESQFFGTDPNTLSYSLLAHKEVFTSLSQRAQIASEYDSNFSYFRKNNVEQWIKILTKRNGQRDWVRNVYD